MSDSGAAGADARWLAEVLGALAVVAVGVVGPWIWIASRGVSTSAWGAGVEPVDERVERQASSPWRFESRGTVLALACLVVVFLVHFHSRSRTSFWEFLGAYTLCWLPSAVILLWAWYRMGRPADVYPGLMADFFLWGGVGLVYAVIFESLAKYAWQLILPTCTRRCFDISTHPCSLEELMPMTETCEVAVALNWILTAGLVEETGKALWLFFRLRKRVGDLPAICCGCLPASQACGWWYKPATTASHVLLCSLSAGAGFGCLENLAYVFSEGDGQLPQESPLTVAIIRAATSNLHMMWTGLIGLGLARRMFCGPSQSLLFVVMPSVILHGLYDFGTTLKRNVLDRESRGIMGDDEASELTLIWGQALVLVSSVGGWLALGLLSRHPGGGCCFAPGLFGAASARSREAALGAGPAEAARQPLLLQ